MSAPAKHKCWVECLKKERAWEDNAVTSRLLTELGDEDLAAVMWAYFREDSIKVLDEPMQALNPNGWRSFFKKKKTIRILITTEEGRNTVWQMLEAAGAWL